jgi:hypothetical protein
MTITNQYISFKLSGISYSGNPTQLNYTADVTAGTCVASKALVVDVNRSLTNVNVLTLTTLNATTVAGTISTAAQPNITSLGTLSNLVISNNLTLNQHNGSTIGLILGSTLVTATGIQLNYNDITTIGVAQASKALILDSSSNITGINNLSASLLSTTNFTLNGVQLTVNGTQLNYNNITTPGVAQASRTLVLNSSSNISGINILSATTLTATTINGSLATASQPNITSLGTLTSLTLSGAISGITNLSMTGALSGATNVSATNLTGTIATAAQPNITSLGNLTNLTITNLLTANSINTLGLSINGTDITSSLSNLSTITGVTNGTASNSKALILDSSRNITNINSLTATSLVSTNITGSLQTASQPNVTSLGTLSTLAISGSISTVNNIAMTGSLTGANSISATNFNGTIATVSQPNITSLGTLSSLLVSGSTGLGTSLPSRQLEINNSTGSCLRLSHSAPTGSSTNFTDFTLNSSGALSVNSSNDLINLQSRVVIGKSATANILCFNGVNGDAGNNMSVIAERVYNNSDFTELLLFKGNDPAGAAGPDRIRMRTGEIRFQIIQTPEDFSTLGDNNDAMVISTTGRIGINCFSPSQQLEINNSIGNCLRLIYNNSGSPTAYSDINVNINGGLNIKSTVNTVQIGDNSDVAQTLFIGTSLTTGTTGVLRILTTTAGNYLQSGVNTTSGSSSDFIIGDYAQAITASNRKIIFRSNGRVGFGTSLPSRQLEINETSGSCLRLSFNASSGSATTFCDQTISSIGLTTFNVAGSGPGFAFTGGNVAAVISTAAQPNITSLGTLTSLTLSGAITGVTNLSLSGNLTGATSISATSFVGLLTTVAQPNVTSLGTLSELLVSGNVKVGVTSSSALDLLHIASNTNSFTGLRIENRNATATSSGSKISFAGFSSTSTDYEIARIAAITTDSGVSASYQFGSLAFYTRNTNLSANAEERMRLTAGGNLGLGTTSPSYLLEVSGTSRTTKLLIGSSTDNAQNRFISALDSSMANGATRFIVLGKTANTNNQAEIGYIHQSDGNSLNSLTLGLFGSERIRIQANGKIGINTTAPVAILDFGTNSTDQTLFLFNGTTSAYGFGANNNTLKYQSFGIHTWFTGSTSTSTGTQLMTLLANGNLGINQSAPSRALDVNGRIGMINDGLGFSHFSLPSNGVEVLTKANGTSDGVIGTFSNHPFSIMTGNVNRVRFNVSNIITFNNLTTFASTNNSSLMYLNNNTVQIGTNGTLNNSVNCLEVGAGSGPGGNNVTSTLYSAYFAGLVDGGGSFRATGITPPASGIGVEIHYAANQGSVFAYNRNAGSQGFLPLTLNNSMYITAAGLVGIGNTTPSEILDVTGTIKTTKLVSSGSMNASYYYSPIGSATATYVSNWPSNVFWGLGADTSSADNTVRLGICSSAGAWSGNYANFRCNNLITQGNIGIGTTAPNYPLHINRTAGPDISATYFVIKPNYATTITANASNISLYTLGRIYCGDELNVASDRRMKENIISLEDDWCEKFIRLTKSVKYNYIGKEGLHYGYIAQDLLALDLGDGIVNMIENPNMEDTVDEEACIKNPKGIQFTIAYDKIVPILSKGIKIAYNKIDNLISENKELKNKIEILEQKNNEINDLKKQMEQMQKSIEFLLQNN